MARRAAAAGSKPSYFRSAMLPWRKKTPICSPPLIEPPEESAGGSAVSWSEPAKAEQAANPFELRLSLAPEWSGQANGKEIVLQVQGGKGCERKKHCRH